MNPTVRDLKKELLEKFEEIFSETEEPEPQPEPVETTQAHMDALAEFHKFWGVEEAVVHLNSEDIPVLHCRFRPRSKPRKVEITGNRIDDAEGIAFLDVEKSRPYAMVDFFKVKKGVFEFDLGDSGKAVLSGAFISL